MKGQVRRTAVGLVVCAFVGGAVLTAVPAYALCTVQLVNRSAGTTSTCSDFANGWVVVAGTNVRFTISCSGFSFSSTGSSAGSLPQACQATASLTVLFGNGTGFGYID